MRCERRIILLLSLLCVAAAVSAQVDIVGDMSSARKLQPAEKGARNNMVALSSRIVRYPAFPGGDDSLMAYLQHNIVYPATAVQHQRQGTVQVSFVVDSVGAIRDIRLRNDIGDGCGAEAVRVVSAMPRWNPALNSVGRHVATETMVEVSFQLDNLIPSGVDLNPNAVGQDEEEELATE
ncbi:MAG: energy transducer TonB [Bacteroidales bacterium]|nr:energy transducer TonB [Bacteroidales bacterium]